MNFFLWCVDNCQLQIWWLGKRQLHHHERNHLLLAKIAGFSLCIQFHCLQIHERMVFHHFLCPSLCKEAWQLRMKFRKPSNPNWMQHGPCSNHPPQLSIVFLKTQTVSRNFHRNEKTERRLTRHKAFLGVFKKQHFFCCWKLTIWPGF